MINIISYLPSYLCLVLCSFIVLSCSPTNSSRRVEYIPRSELVYLSEIKNNSNSALVEIEWPEVPDIISYSDIQEETVETVVTVTTKVKKPKIHVIKARVTACSPQDPQDIAYYRKHGYEGAVYNIAACLDQFPRGTKIRVPGYMEESYPGKWWTVDSAGGSVIRRSARKGIYHIDVKYRTYYSAKKWGNKWMNIEVIFPKDR